MWLSRDVAFHFRNMLVWCMFCTDVGPNWRSQQRWIEHILCIQNRSIQGSYDRENSIRFIPEVVSCGFTIYFNVGVTKRNRKWAKRWVVSVIYLIEVPWQPKITFQKPTFKNSHIHRRFFPPVGFHKSPTQRRRGQKRKRPGWQDVDRRRYDGQWMQPTTIRYLWIRNILPVTVAFMKV